MLLLTRAKRFVLVCLAVLNLQPTPKRDLHCLQVDRPEEAATKGKKGKKGKKGAVAEDDDEEM